LRQGLDTSKRQGYATELASLWGALSRTLSRLEAIAAEPDEWLEDAYALESIPVLQYELHCASELALGMAPPAGAETAHAELRAALTDARDATAEVVDAVEASGAGAALPLVPEWRGSLFRVRMARHRLGTRPLAPPAPDPEPPPFPWTALTAVALVVAGAFAFTAGAIIAAWPLWAAGLALVAGGFFAYRP
jgi:hypothetical protein